ncbi:MAG: hypothetical protein IT446_05730 [Phycisphaerales bacterium]|nr:hypothetical protein [Phycisphaerales bacterium]
MMRSGLFAAIVGLVLFGIVTIVSANTPESLPVAVAEVGDPPPPVSGDLGRLGRVPGWVDVKGAGSIAFGTDKWKGDEDLGGSVVLGWDPQFLYVAARVRDQVISQTYTGDILWQGDHVMLVLDVPRQEGVRDKNKIFQIGISPGNFKPNGIAAEVYQWAPTRGSIVGARVGAVRTSDGYQIEAAIPWKSLGVDKADKGMRIGYDVSLSDSDQTGDSIQDKLTSLMPDKWELRNPDHLVEGVLASGDGKIDPNWIKSAFELVRSDIRVDAGKTVKVEAGQFDRKPIEELVVRARLDFKTVAGGNAFMQVFVNGKLLDIDRVRNRLQFMDMGARQIASMGGKGVWFVFFSPDFNPIPNETGYAVQGVDPFEFRFDVSDLWNKQGQNSVEIHNLAQSNEYILMAEVGVSERLSRKIEPPKLRPAPTGEIPTIVPKTEAKPPYTFEQTPGGAIEVALGDQKWVIESSFSTITPGWAKLGMGTEPKSEWKTLNKTAGGLNATATGFELRRTITRHDDHLQVVDRITNTLDEDLPVMYGHRTKVDRKTGRLFLAGMPITQGKSMTSTPEHPVTLMLWDHSGLGLIGEDDLTRVQASNIADEDVVGIQNDRLVVGKGKTIELEFSIYPMETGEYFDFINRVRRTWNVNFQLTGSHADTHSEAPGMNLEMSDEAIKAILDNKSAIYGIAWVSYYNLPGNNWHDDDLVLRRQRMLDRIKRAKPDFCRLMYYHCFAAFQDPRTMTDENAAYLKSHFKADAILRPNGQQADYSNPNMPLFLPTEGSAWARATEEGVLDYRMERSKFEGVFWDETAYSSDKYDYNPNHWDGVTADIDPNTHRIARRITSVTLASLSWRENLAKKIMSKHVLMGNGAPHTRTFTRLHFLRFVETSSINNLLLAQLYTPIQLGDHLTERNEVDCYRNMVRGLDFGGVYYWYRPEIIATHPTLTSYMFPITPVNLGHGYIIGKERILTNTSGYFGWGDKSEFEAVVFDTRGNKTDEVKIPRIEKDGKVFAEVRIGEGYSVALIRK